MYKKQTLYVSSAFSSFKEAQSILCKDGFFLFDIHQVLFESKGISPLLKGLAAVKNKKQTFFQATRLFFYPKTWKHLKDHYNQGNRVTEVYLDAAQAFPILHNELLDFSNNIYKPHLQMYTLLSNLKKDHNLYLLSNIGGKTFERLKNTYPEYFALMAHPENTINSLPTTHALWKPQRSAFTESLRLINQSHNPHLAIFVDDKDANIKAAHQAGMNAIRFTSYQQFEKDLAILLGKDL